MLKESNKSDETEWFKWAEEKADWFDPTISSEDKLLGKRNHKADIEEKQLISKKRMSSYNW